MQQASHLICDATLPGSVLPFPVSPLLGSLPYATTSLDHIILADPRSPPCPLPPLPESLRKFLQARLVG